ncbi:MAG: phosphatase PAP2 family protein [Acidobacteriota bacterium]
MTRLQWYKVLVTVVLTAWVSAPYYALQRWQVFPARAVRPTSLDHLIPFHGSAVGVYLSLYLLLPLTLLLMERREDVRSAAQGLALIATVSHLAFFLMPTYMPLPRTISAESDFLYRWMTTMDGPFNACPSLHASLGIFAASWCQRLLRTKLYARGVWLWTGAILLATLVTKQHVLWDLVVGGSLGLMVYYVGELRRRAQEKTSTVAVSPVFAGSETIPSQFGQGAE